MIRKLIAVWEGHARAMLPLAPETGSGEAAYLSYMMQTPRAEPARAPQAPAIPSTSAELSALRARRDVLREQLESATEWRGRLVQERHNAAATNNLEVVRELDGRISEFGDRAVRLERQLLATEDAISQAVTNGVGRERGVNVEIAPIPPIPPIPRFITTESSGGNIARERVGMMMLGEAILFALLAVVLWRTAFRRGARSVQVGAGGGPQNTAQLQQSIDAIAVEVERISENQRFVTKLLNEQGAGASSQR